MGKWDSQSETPDSKVMVSGEYCKDGEVRTDFLLIDRETGEHGHASVSPEPGSDVVIQHDLR